MATGNGELLQVVDLHVKRDEREILRGINLSVRRGEVHAVLGLNGSGKSTLAYTLIGSGGYIPDRGEIRFDHGELGGVEVLPRTRATVEEGGRYISEFNQSKGRVGRMDLDLTVDVGANGLAELTARALGYGDDEITVRETIRLNGENARGLAKSRVAVRDRARSEVYATTEGHAPFARGHVDCVEIVRDQAIANAVPVVRVTNDRAQITHEAAIGTVGKKELETLMSRGVSEEAAVDVIVRGMLGG